MTERKTPPIKGTFLPPEEFWDDGMRCRVPGSILRNSLTDPDDNPPEGVEHWYYACPCGCGAAGGLYVAVGIKPPSPSWLWNGSTDAPVLSPSVHHIGHWHGWLGGSGGEQPGKWISC